MTTLLAVVTVLVAGWVIDHHTRTTALERAHSAFSRGDCTGSLRNYAEADKGRVPWGSTAHSRHAERSERDQCGQIKVLADTWDTGKLVQAASGYAQFMVDNRDSPALISLDQLVMKSGNAQALLDSVPGKAACTAFESLRETSLMVSRDEVRGVSEGRRVGSGERGVLLRESGLVAGVALGGLEGLGRV